MIDTKYEIIYMCVAIIGIYTEDGTYIGGYTYDAWGTIKTNEVTSATTLQRQIVRNYNPFRYRGYYYDTNSSLYYLQSRYYDPATGRFINVDSALYNSMLGYNMYLYCNNSPVNYYDPAGESAEAVATGWGATMWWLTLVDGPIPIGDILYVGGCIVAGTLVISGTINALNETTPVENSLTESGEGSSVKAKSGSSKGKGKNRSGNGKKSSKKSGKERASNKPSWANPDMIDPQKTAQQNAQRMLDDKYGHGSWPKGASTEYSKIVKWIQRGGYLGGTIYWICGKDSLVFSWEE